LPDERLDGLLAVKLLALLGSPEFPDRPLLNGDLPECIRLFPGLISRTGEAGQVGSSGLAVVCFLLR
jgi:hypothetical protein